MSGRRTEKDSDLGDSAATDSDVVANLCDDDLVDANVDDEMRSASRVQAEVVLSESSLVYQEAETAPAAESSSTPPRTTALSLLQAENVELKRQLALAQNDASEVKAQLADQMAKALGEKHLLLDRIAQLERVASTAGFSSAHSEHSASPSSPQPSTSTGITRGGGESQKYWAKRFRESEDSSDSREGPDPKKRKEPSPEETVGKDASAGSSSASSSSSSWYRPRPQYKWCGVVNMGGSPDDKEGENAKVATVNVPAAAPAEKGKDQKESEETGGGVEENAERGEVVAEERERDSEENVDERGEDDDGTAN